MRQNSIIEQQVLSYILQNKDIAILEDNNITAEDFVPSRKPIVEYIFKHLKEYGNLPDETTIISRFPEDYISARTDESPMYLEDSLKEHVKFIRTAKILQVNEKGLINGGDDADLAIRNIIKGLDSINNGLTQSRATGVNIIQDHSRLTTYNKKHSGDFGKTYDIGIEAIDAILGGIQSDDVVLVFARTSHGKSVTMVKIAHSMWKSGLKILYYSGEMDADQVAYRFDALDSHVSSHSLLSGRDLFKKNVNTGNITPIHIEEYEQYLEELKEHRNEFVVVTPKDDFDGQMPTPNDIEKLIDSEKPDVVFIDQLTLMKDNDRARKKQEAYGNMMRDIRMLSATKGIPIFVAHQANRLATEKSDTGDQMPPEMHHVAESDTVGQYATRALGIVMNRSVENLELMTIAVRKNRHGNLGEVKLLVDIDKGYYQEYEPEEDLDSSVTVFDKIETAMNDGVLSESIEGFDFKSMI